MLKILTYRTLNALLVLLTIIASLVAILFFQNYLQLDPCPLCIFQRIGLWVMGVFAFLALIINPRKFAIRILLWLGAMVGAVWGYLWQVAMCGCNIFQLMKCQRADQV